MFAIWLVKEYKNAILNIESISTNWILSFLSLFVISTLYMYNQHSVYMNRLLRYSEDILSHESVLPRCFSANLGFIHIFNTKCSTLTILYIWSLKVTGGIWNTNKQQHFHSCIYQLEMSIKWIIFMVFGNMTPTDQLLHLI